MQNSERSKIGALAQRIKPEGFDISIAPKDEETPTAGERMK